jgi:exodeoxyribonuclease III
MSYNLRNGAVSTYDKLIECIQKLQPDVLCVQEANSWHEGTPSLIETFAQSTGMPYWQFGNSNTDYKLVTFSKYPITNGLCVTEGFWHSALRITIPWQNTELTIWNVHFDPRSRRHRLAEATLLIQHIEKVERTIITGDLNSISRLDDYPSDLLDKLLENSIKKFGNKVLSFSVLDYLSDNGFIDTAAQGNALETTVPTKSNVDFAHAIELRLDYVMASKDIAPYVRRVDVVKSELTDVISDHYPVLATIEKTE